MLFASLATSTRARRGFCSSIRAICRPIPLDAPVNTTTLSWKVRMVARLPTRNGVGSLPLGKGNIRPRHLPLKRKFQRGERGFKRPFERERIHGSGELAARQRWSIGLGLVPSDGDHGLQTLTAGPLVQRISERLLVHCPESCIEQPVLAKEEPQKVSLNKIEMQISLFGTRSSPIPPFTCPDPAHH
mmetsp:Transcript_4751/g.30063  ORF Transcript_4751/g.30063 Transcript_4751/m.30063 type:complete len:187 (-) Transcript_4751:1186-1746(-)